MVGTDHLERVAAAVVNRGVNFVGRRGAVEVVLCIRIRYVAGV